MQDFINKHFFNLYIFTLIFGHIFYGTIGFDYTDETADLLEKGKVSVLVGQEQKQMGYESLNTAV